MSSTQSFYGPCLQSVVHSLAVFLGMCHSSTRPGTSYHVTRTTHTTPAHTYPRHRSWHGWGRWRACSSTKCQWSHHEKGDYTHVIRSFECLVIVHTSSPIPPLSFLSSSPYLSPSFLISFTLVILLPPPLDLSSPFLFLCLFSLPPPSSFSQVIEWATHHKDDPPPPEDDENKEKRTDDIEPWDQEFLKVDQGTLFELILVGAVVASVIDCITCMWCMCFFAKIL